MFLQNVTDCGDFFFFWGKKLGAEAGLLSAVYETIVFLQDVSESDFVAIPRELQVRRWITEKQMFSVGSWALIISKKKFKKQAAASDLPHVPPVTIMGAECNIGIGMCV